MATQLHETVKDVSGRQVTVSLALRPGQVLAGGLAVAVGMTLLSVLGHLQPSSTLQRLSDVDQEQSLPSLWSVVQLLLVAAAALLVSARSGRDRRAWRWVTVGLVYLALDEGLSFHEELSFWTRRLVDPAHAHRSLTLAWVIPGALAVLVVGALALGFLRRMEGTLRRDLLLSAGLFLFGALVLESVGSGLYTQTHQSFAYLLEAHVEEFFEMSSVACAGAALLRYETRRAVARP